MARNGVHGIAPERGIRHNADGMNTALRFLVWGIIAMLGALAIGVIAAHRGEPINAMWLVVAAGCCYALAYRFYSKFIAAKILEIGRAHV